MREARTSVVIPMLNEARNLPHVLPRVPEAAFEVILVDGGSRDASCREARRLLPDVRVIPQTRRGKGNALECGFRAARGDVIVFLDADGSTDPAEIPTFVAALLDGADFAKGSRFMRGGGSSDITPLRRQGNRVLCGIVNGLYGTSYTDLCYGYNAFWRSLLPALGVADDPRAAAATAPWGDGFEVETLINVRVANSGLKVVEVPSMEYERIHGVSNLNAVRDGLRVLGVIAQEHRRRAAARSSAAPMFAVDTTPHACVEHLSVPCTCVAAAAA